MKWQIPGFILEVIFLLIMFLWKLKFYGHNLGNNILLILFVIYFVKHSYGFKNSQNSNVRFLGKDNKKKHTISVNCYCCQHIIIVIFSVDFWNNNQDLESLSLWMDNDGLLRQIEADFASNPNSEYFAN